MKDTVLFALGTACGAVATAWSLGVRPAEPPEQVIVIARAPAPPAPPIPPAPEPAAVAPAAPDAEPLPAVQPMAPDSPVAPQQLIAQDPVPAAGPALLSVPTTPGSGALAIPVYGLKATQLVDNFNERRGAELHDALDIMAPRGTPVIAVADGKIAKLFSSKPGGLTIYEFDASERYAYYYAHLDRYAQGLAEGQAVKKGDVIGFVGSTGNANPKAPHLHFSVFVLGPQKRWWQGTAINPYPLLTAK